MQSQKLYNFLYSKKTLGEKNAHILGSFILSAFQLAILARANIPKPQRQFFSLIIDEFHSYADSTNVDSINSLLSEARKYRVSLITATQFLAQVDRRIKDAILGNVGTLLCLRVGIDDAQVLQKELGQFTAEDLLNLKVGQAIVRMGTAQESFNLQIPLLEKPPQNYKEEILRLNQKRKRVTTPLTTVTPIVVPAPITPSSQPNQTQSNLLPKEKEFLKFLYQTTQLLPIGKLGQATGLNKRKIYNLVDSLSQKRLIAETRLSLALTAGYLPVIA